MSFLRDETKRHGFPTPDGVHIGPCDVHMKHAHTIGPDGSLYACPGFTGEKSQSTGHIDDRRDAWREDGARAVRPPAVRGTSAETARSSRCARAGAWSPRTQSLAT